jgi:hypothetical protein
MEIKTEFDEISPKLRKIKSSLIILEYIYFPYFFF